MQQEYPHHCEPLSSFRSHSTSSPRRKSSLLSIPAVCQSGREPHQKVLDLGFVTDWVDGGEEGRKELCGVRVVVFGGAEGQGHNRTICSGVGFRLVDKLERFCTTQSVGQGGPVFIPPFIPPSIPPPFHLPPPTTTCLQATTSVPREMSATEKKAHKGLTFHMAGSPRLKRPDNPRRLD